MIQVGVLAGDGPIYRGSSHTCPLGSGKDIILGKDTVMQQGPMVDAIPVGTQREITENTVLLGIATGHQAGMGRIGAGRVHRAYPVDLCPFFHDLFEIGFLLHIGHIFVDHGVHGKNKKFLLHSYAPKVLVATMSTPVPQILGIITS